MNGVFYSHSTLAEGLFEDFPANFNKPKVKILPIVHAVVVEITGQSLLEWICKRLVRLCQ